MPAPLRRATFRNWAGNQVCVPQEILKPRSPDEVAAIVGRAAAAGLTVKAVGAGHSFTDAACTRGILVSLDLLAAVERIDAQRGRVTVQAGIRLDALNRELDAVGLAMPNLGDIDRQSLAGATATATHGTGLGLGNLATTIVGMEIVDGRGELIGCDEHERSELPAGGPGGGRGSRDRYPDDPAVRPRVRPACHRDRRTSR